jgi:DNA replication protein DnaC
MNSSTLIPNTTRLAHELRLFGIHAGIERRSHEALAAGHHPLEYLRLILEDERLFRQERVAKMLSTRAKFRSDAALEDWDHSHERSLSKAQFKEVAALGFYQNRENLLIVGSTGTGKTHLAIALGKKLCAEGVGVQFFSVNLLFEECQAEKAAGRYLKLIRRLKQVPALILDDFGLRNYTHEEANVLIDILEERYQKGSVLLTSQVDPKGWRKLFEDPVIAEAITDRLTKPAKQITLKGGSYREKLKPNSVETKKQKE